MMKRTIAHFIKRDIKNHQKFIYDQINLTRKYRSIVIAPFTKGKKTQYSIKNFYYLKQLKSLKKFFKKQNVIGIHTHHGKDIEYTIPLATKYNIPLIVSFRGRDGSAQYRAFKRNSARYKTLKRKGTLFLPVCKFLKGELIKLGFPKNKTHVLYGGIDLDLFSYSKRRLPKNAEIIILSLGRPVKKKGFKTLLKAFKKIHKVHPNTKLHIIGPEKNNSKIISLLQRYHLTDAVKLKGKMNSSQVSKELKKAHIFCLASETTIDGDVEGIPNVLKEAMASGLPIVSTEHAGIPELVEHKKTGYLVPEKDHKQLSEGIKYFLNHPEIWAEYTLRARKRVEEQFDLKKQIKKQEKYYAHIETRRGKR